MSGTSKQAKGRASDPVFPSLFLVVLNHSASPAVIGELLFVFIPYGRDEIWVEPDGAPKTLWLF